MLGLGISLWQSILGYEADSGLGARPSGDGLALEDGSGFLQLENGSYLLLESSYSPLSLTQTIGIRGAVASNGDMAISPVGGMFGFAEPVLKNGTLTRFKCYASGSDSVTIRRYTQSGATLTQTGADIVVSVAAGSNDIVLSQAVNSGEYLGIIVPTNSGLRYKSGAATPYWVSATNLTTINTTNRLDFSFGIDRAETAVPRGVTLLAGQSNAQGFGLRTGLAADLSNYVYSARIWNRDVSVSDFQAYAPRVTAQGFAPEDHGPEARFLKLLGDVDLVKYGVAGTSLIAGAGGWNIVDALWPTFAASVNAATAAIAMEGRHYIIDRMIWIQGETDASAGQSTAQYRANLEAIIADSRTRWGATLPWYIVQLNAAVLYPPANIRAAQQAVVAADTHSFLVDVDAISLDGDNVHYTTAGYDAMGTAIYNKIIGS